MTWSRKVLNSPALQVLPPWPPRALRWGANGSVGGIAHKIAGIDGGAEGLAEDGVDVMDAPPAEASVTVSPVAAPARVS
jgi:hypothetical protein